MLRKSVLVICASEKSIRKTTKDDLKSDILTNVLHRPWLKYYSKEALLASIPETTLYEHMYQNNKTAKSNIALNYFGNKITYEKLFCLVEETANAFDVQGVLVLEVRA